MGGGSVMEKKMIRCRWCSATFESRSIAVLRRVLTAHYQSDHPVEVARYAAQYRRLTD